MARTVLQDCRNAISNHDIRLQGESFRISWVAIVTLLQTIGHVLSKVDSQLSANHKIVIDNHWKALNFSKPEPKIFWEFIEQERNNVLKQYQLGVARWMQLPALVLPQGSTVMMVDMANSRGGGGVNENLYPIHTQITSGPFRGRKEFDVIAEAADWWGEQLSEIEAALVKRGINVELGQPIEGLSHL